VSKKGLHVAQVGSAFVEQERLIMQVLHDEIEADDVLQEVLLQVWDRRPAIPQKRENC
jgi:DNA-directed RNA polymerase specialized sigma24 family protein